MGVDNERLHLLIAIVRAADECGSVIDTIASADSDETADALLQERFRWTPLQAAAVMAMQFRRVTAANKQRIRGEIAQIRVSNEDPRQNDGGPEGFVGDAP